MTDGKRFGPTKLLVISYFKRSSKHFKYPLISMTIGVWGIIVVTSIINGFSSLLIDSITSFYPHIVIRGEYNKDLSEITEIINFNLTSGAIINNNQIFYSQLMEIDDLTFYQPFFEENIESEALILGKKLAEKLRVKKGDSILIVQSKGILPITKEYTVGGTFESGVSSYDENFILHQNSDKKEYTGIFLQNPNKAQKFKKNYLSDYNALTWEESNETLYKAIQVDSLIALLITIFIILISGFSISNSVLFSVFTRKREIAIIRALGVKRKQIQFILVMETFLVSILGFILGSLTGILNCWILNIMKIPLPEGLFYVEYLPVKVSSINFLIAFLLNSSVAFLFSYIASRHTTKINIVETLKQE